MFNLETYRDAIREMAGHVATLAKTLDGLNTRKAQMSGEYYDQQATEARDNARASIEAVKVDALAGIARDVETAKRKAEAFSYPFDERTYYATISAQALEGRDHKQLIALYAEVGASGNDVHRRELLRVLAPVLDPLMLAEWIETRRKYMTVADKDFAIMTEVSSMLQTVINAAADTYTGSTRNIQPATTLAEQDSSQDLIMAAVSKRIIEESRLHGIALDVTDSDLAKQFNALYKAVGGKA